MLLSSPNFENNTEIPSEFTCDGSNHNPTLVFDQVPIDAQELVLIIDDPDAPGGLFTHWLVWGIDPKIGIIETNQIPENAIQGMNDFGENNYRGPCPPSGVHRYRFNLYALNSKSNLVASADRASVDAEISNIIIDSAQLVGLYASE